MTTNIAFHDVNHSYGYGVISGASIVSQNISESASNQQSSAATKTFVTVVSTVAIYVAFGASPDATVSTGRMMLPASVPATFGIDVGHKVAVVTA